MIRNLFLLCLTFSWACTFTQTLYATVITADTTGSDNVSTPDFYGVQFLSGPVSSFIQSVTWDISSDTNAFFDFDGAGSFGNATLPVVGARVGLTMADISFTLIGAVGGNSQHPNILRANFFPGSFGIGDSFRFGADTDFFVFDPAPGSVFGNGGAVFSVLLESGQSASSNFVVVNTQQSLATVNVNQQAVPEPSSLIIFVIGTFVSSAFVRSRS